MKRFMAILLAISILLTMGAGLVGCGQKEDNVLKVGMECGCVSFNWTQVDDSNGAVAIHDRNTTWGVPYKIWYIL